MKFANLKAFEKHLESAAPNHFGDIYMIIAKDSFARKMALDRLLPALIPDKTKRELGLKILDGSQLTVDQMNSELNALTLFANRQVILIDQADELEKQVQKELEAYFTHPSRSSFLVLVASSINHATNFYKKAEKGGIILEIEEEKGWAKEKGLVELATAIVAKEGKRIDPKACQHLVKHAGSDLALLHHELEKLICYVGDRVDINLQDVAAICTSANLETVWQLGEAIFNRDASSALRISKALMDSGTNLFAMLKQIRNQLQTDFQVCTLMASGGSTSDVTRLFPYMKGYVLERHLQMAQAYGYSRFKRGMQKIDEIGVMAKNSATSEDLLAEMLIIHLVS